MGEGPPIPEEELTGEKPAEGEDAAGEKMSVPSDAEKARIHEENRANMSPEEQKAYHASRRVAREFRRRRGRR